jgi:hypothetical protein
MIYATQPSEPRAQGDAKADAAPKTNALVAEHFVLQEPEAQGDHPMRVLGDDGPRRPCAAYR